MFTVNRYAFAYIIILVVRSKGYRTDVFNIIVDCRNGELAGRDTGFLYRVNRRLDAGKSLAAVDGQSAAGQRLDNLDAVAAGGKTFGAGHNVLDLFSKLLSEVAGGNNAGRNVNGIAAGIGHATGVAGEYKFVSFAGGVILDGDVRTLGRNIGKLKLAGCVVNVVAFVAESFVVAGQGYGCGTFRNAGRHSPRVRRLFGISQAHIAGVAQAVINQSVNAVTASGTGNRRIINRVVSRQVGTVVNLLGRGCRTTDGGQVNRAQVAVINDIVIDVNRVAVAVVISFHIFYAVDVNDIGVRVAVPRQQRPALQVETAGVLEITLVINIEVAGTGVCPHIAFSRVGRGVYDKVAVTADTHCRGRRVSRQQTLSVNALFGYRLHTAGRIVTAGGLFCYQGLKSNRIVFITNGIYIGNVVRDSAHSRRLSCQA